MARKSLTKGSTYQNPASQVDLGNRNPKAIEQQNKRMGGYQNPGARVDLNRRVFSGPGEADFKKGEYQNPGSMAAINRKPIFGAGNADDTPYAPQPYVKKSGKKK